MMISTRGRYALRVMLELAEHPSDDYIPLKDIARKQDISEKYLESILPALIKQNFLLAHRGKGGGYRLARAPETYTVGSIIKLVENSLAPVTCLEGETNECSRAQDCRTLPMWRKLNQMIDDYLEGITLAELCHGMPEHT